MRIERVVVATDRQAEAGARLLERGSGTLAPQLVVACVELGQHRSVADLAAEVHVPAREPAGDLEAELGPVFGGERPDRHYRARDAALLRLDELHPARSLLGRVLFRLAGTASGDPFERQRSRDGERATHAFLFLLSLESPS